MPNKTLGELAYEAFRASWKQDEMFEFSKLPEDVRRAWEAAAAAVADSVRCNPF